MSEFILTLNSGSSSLKFSVFESVSNLTVIGSGSLTGIGTEAGRFAAHWHDKNLSESIDLKSHQSALERLLIWLEDKVDQERLIAVGHRLVHGGRQFQKPTFLDDSVIRQLEELSCFAPLHLPAALSTVNAARLKFRRSKHIACFDTSFHRTMPMVAKVLPVSKLLFDEGVEKFGFHGLSYEFALSELSRFGGGIALTKLLIAHLGNGCSIVGVDGGQSIDTTMGFSPAGGLVMGTRTGDIDPGLISYFVNQKKYSAEQFVTLANRESGLLGISGLSSDMQELLRQEHNNADARLAIEIFCYHVRKHIGALAAVLGGLTGLVFTGGIGENSAVIRERICQHLGFLGVSLDRCRNEAIRGTGEITSPGAATRTFVVKTNEELMIATHCRSLLERG